MGIIDQKSKVFGNIAAARRLSEGLPKLTTNPSFPSINNDGDSLAFLIDLLKSLVGLEKLRNIIIDTLSYDLDEIEISIKNAIKLSLKELVNCGVDPSIPSYIKSGGSGISIETKKIDFFGILKTEPSSTLGNLIYTDTLATPLTSSNDYNTFLYATIQNDGSTETWNNGNGILDVRFDSVNISPTPNNTLKFNANSAFNNKTLTEFNNTFVDSIDLFDSNILLNKLLDMIFGAVSIQLDKSVEQLKKEEQIKTIIDCIVNADDNDVIDDSYFTFTNDQIASQESSANWRKKGIRIVETCQRLPISVNPRTINTVNLTISGATTTEAKKGAIEKGIDLIADELGGQAIDSKDSHTLKLNFVEDLIKNLITSIVSAIISPKVISIFLINYKIVYGVGQEYEDAIDFMKQNKNLVKSISKSVRDSIISILLNSVLKEVSILIASTATEIATEKAKNQVSQILSLVGIPTEIIRMIKGL